MKKLLIILLALPMIGFGQGWTLNYTGSSYEDIGVDVIQAPNGDYLIVGELYDGDYTPVLIKVDANGIFQSEQIYGPGVYLEKLESIEKTNDGGYILCGEIRYDQWGMGCYPTDDVWLIKIDANGNLLWDRQFDFNNTYDRAMEAQQTNDGGYIITGSADNKILLIKTDEDGDQQWNQILDSTTTNEQRGGFSVEQTTDGGYIVGGISGLGTPCLIKTDEDGNQQWNQTFGGVTNNAARSVEQTTDGGYIFTGEYDNNIVRDLWLVKTDENGVEQWSKTFGASNDAKGYSVTQTTDGGYIVCGQIESIIFYDGLDVYLIKTDENGVEQWSKTFGGTSRDRGYSVEQTTDGGYIITGETRSFSNNREIYIIKTDGNGNVTSTFNIPINPNRKLEKTVDILGKQTKPQPNTPFIEIYDDGTVEKRIVIE